MLGMMELLIILVILGIIGVPVVVVVIVVRVMSGRRRQMEKSMGDDPPQKVSDPPRKSV